MVYYIKSVLMWTGIGVVLAVLLDLVYSTIYLNVKADRNPVQIALFTQNKNFDYIIMGSSRGNYHVNTPMINQKHNVNGFNFAYPGAQTNEALLLLKILLSNENQMNRIFIQLDNHDNFFDSTLPDSLAMQSFMPYIYKKEVWSHYFHYPKFWPYLFIPFYRYIMNRPNIGEREVLMTLIRKRPDHQLGFTPLMAQSINKPGIPGNYPAPRKTHNLNIIEFLDLCNKHGIQVEFFTSPVYLFDNSVNEYFHEIFQNHYTDFSTEIQCDSCYRDAFHLNFRGADLFTRLFMNKYFENSN